MVTIEELIVAIKDKETTDLSLNVIDFENEMEEKFQELALAIKESKLLLGISFKDVNLASVNFIKIQPILLAIQENKKIKDLYFSFSNLGEANKNLLDALYDCVKSGKKSIVINRDSITASSVNVLGFIENLKNTEIERLEFSLTKLGNDSEVFESTIYDLIQCHLKSLSLASNGIGTSQLCGTGLINLFNTEIDDINLSDNPLGCETTTEDWNEIFNLIEGRKSLKFLNLSHCSLNILEEEEEFSKLLISFVRNTNLREINLSNNEFSKELTLNLIQSAKENKNNLQLKCEGNGLSVKEIESLKNLKTELIQTEISTFLPQYKSVESKLSQIENIDIQYDMLINNAVMEMQSIMKNTLSKLPIEKQSEFESAASIRLFNKPISTFKSTIV